MTPPTPMTEAAFEAWRKEYCPDADREGDCRAAFAAGRRAGLEEAAKWLEEGTDSDSYINCHDAADKLRTQASEQEGR